MKRTIGIACLIIGVIAFTCACTNMTGVVLESKPQIHTVKPGDNLDVALGSIKDGETIHISKGDYVINDPLVITGKKNIRIEGDDDVWILGERINMQVLKLENCSDVQLYNIKGRHLLEGKEKLEGVKFDGRLGSVLDMEGCNRVNIDKCELEGCGVYGVYGVECDAVELVNCNLHHNSVKAIAFFNKKNISNVVVKDCKITNNKDLLYKDDNVNIKFEGDNIIKDNDEKGYSVR